MPTTLLDHIWANALEVVEPAQLSPLPGMLASISRHPIICVRSRFSGDHRLATASFASEEILPGATLADILFEECGIEVDDDCIVYLETAAMQKSSNLPVEMLSGVMGEIVIRLATRNPSLLLSGMAETGMSMAHLTTGGRARKLVTAVVQ